MQGRAVGGLQREALQQWRLIVMPELALLAVGALLAVRTQLLRIRHFLLRLRAQEEVQIWTRSAQRIVGWHEDVIYKRVHQQALLHHAPKLVTLQDQIPVVVVGDYNAVSFHCQLEYEAIIVAGHTLAIQMSRWREHQVSFVLQLVEQLLVGYVVVRHLLAPVGHESGDVAMATLPEPVHTDANAAAREYQIVAVRKGDITAIDYDVSQARAVATAGRGGQSAGHAGWTAASAYVGGPRCIGRQLDQLRQQLVLLGFRAEARQRRMDGLFAVA